MIARFPLAGFLVYAAKQIEANFADGLIKSDFNAMTCALASTTIAKGNRPSNSIETYEDMCQDLNDSIRYVRLTPSQAIVTFTDELSAVEWLLINGEVVCG